MIFRKIVGIAVTHNSVILSSSASQKELGTIIFFTFLSYVSYWWAYHALLTTVLLHCSDYSPGNESPATIKVAYTYYVGWDIGFLNITDICQWVTK